MKKNQVILFSIIFLAGLTVGIAFGLISSVMAQQKDFSNIEIVYPSVGMVGIFDKKEGKLYYYDTNLRCIRILQIDELGKSLLKIDVPSRFSSY